MTATSRNPARASWRSTTSMMGIGSSSPSGISGFGKTWVNGLSRVPFPPASSTAFMAIGSGSIAASLPFDVRDSEDDLAGPAGRAEPGQVRPPPGFRGGDLFKNLDEPADV